MSLLLDSLRKGRSSAPREPSVRSAHADSVLATLGYGSPARPRSPSPRVSALLGALVLAFAAWWLWPSLFPARAGGVAQAFPERGRPTKLEEPHRAEGSGPATAARTVGPEPASVNSHPPQLDGRIQRKTESVSGGPATATSAQRASLSDFRLALYYQRAGDFERALSHYQAVLERNELNAEAHNNLGLLYQQKGLLEESAREFSRATLINPRYARAHNNLGVTLMRQGKLDVAAAEFELASSMDARDADCRVNLALVQKAAGGAETAKGTLLNALAIDPSSAAAHYNLALLYDESGEAARAIEHYRAFLGHAGVEHASLAPDVRARVEALTGSR